MFIWIASFWLDGRKTIYIIIIIASCVRGVGLYWGVNGGGMVGGTNSQNNFILLAAEPYSWRDHLMCTIFPIEFNVTLLSCRRGISRIIGWSQYWVIYAPLQWCAFCVKPRMHGRKKRLYYYYYYYMHFELTFHTVIY